MKITVKKSWLPWGTPDIEVDLADDKNYIKIYGAYRKKIKFGFEKWG